MLFRSSHLLSELIVIINMGRDEATAATAYIPLMGMVATLFAFQANHLATITAKRRGTRGDTLKRKRAKLK